MEFIPGSELHPGVTILQIPQIQPAFLGNGIPLWVYVPVSLKPSAFHPIKFN